MAAFFGVGLVAFEVMNGGANVLAGFLVGADGVDDVAYHLEGLKRYHNFIIFNVVSNEHEQVRGLVHEVPFVDEA